MNVSKIQKLSEQHQSLQEFHKVCNHNDVELSVKVSAQSTTAILDYIASKSIIVRVRSIVLNRVCEIEKEIREEVARG